MTTHIVLLNDGTVGELIDSLDCAFRGLPVRVWVRDENGNYVKVTGVMVEHLESAEDWQLS